MREYREVALFVGLVLLIALFPPDVGCDIGGLVPEVGDGTEGLLEMASLETAFDWLDEFGGDLQDSANDVEMDGLDVYVGGSTKGPLVPGMPAGSVMVSSGSTVMKVTWSGRPSSVPWRLTP